MDQTEEKNFVGDFKFMGDVKIEPSGAFHTHDMSIIDSTPRTYLRMDAQGRLWLTSGVIDVSEIEPDPSKRLLGYWRVSLSDGREALLPLLPVKDTEG